MSNAFNNTFEGDQRFLTAFERFAAALELIAQKMPWPFINAVAQPFVQGQPAVYISPNTNGTAVPAAGPFVDLTEGRPMQPSEFRAGTGG
jgi:hypothetical protein